MKRYSNRLIMGLPLNQIMGLVENIRFIEIADSDRTRLTQHAIIKDAIEQNAKPYRLLSDKEYVKEGKIFAKRIEK